MSQEDIEARVKNVDERTIRIEQILPTLATKEDLKGFATKEDLKAYPTRDEMTAAIREDGVLTRAHFDVVAEGLKESIKVIAEGHRALDEKIDNLQADVRHVLDDHEQRIMKLEAKSLKRR